ncbi:G2 and S phase-expressed protein 1-like isoform X2 [Ostrea edulis]|uniref:G2 and S phase-expressed protein 1-like isoform X2 n=1 Tax=Ostrea edulis TaxID=37623 RepID=UPI0020945E95|nr:G2 and S phase-expressed protein 1-like isoform X2 [Ostrea edulis]
MEACGILIDLSEPVETSPPKPVQCKSPSQSESRNNSTETNEKRLEEDDNSLADSIEIERSSDRRGSYTIDRPSLLQDLDEITAESDIRKNEAKIISPDIQLLEDEEFDFDLPISPAVRTIHSLNAEEEDEEVFIGPVGFTEKCVASVVSEIAPIEEPLKPLSPLKPHQIAEIFKEAQLVVYRINNKEKDGDGKGGNSKSESRNGNVHTPVKHQRKGTYTESPEAFVRLPENVVKAMPVIDFEIEDPFQKKSEEDKENFSGKGINFTSPKNKKLPRCKLSNKENATKTGSSRWFSDGLASDTDDTSSVTSDTSEASATKIPITRPGAAETKISKKESGLKRPSMLKPPGAASKSNENLTTVSNKSITKTASVSVGKSKAIPTSNARRSLNTSNRKSLGLNTTGIPKSMKPSSITNIKQNSKEATVEPRKGPSTRLSLMKPSSIQKPAIKSQTTEVKSKVGPLKALPNSSNVSGKMEKAKPALNKQMLLNPEVCTPVKPDKKVQPKLLSHDFTTPVRSNSLVKSSSTSSQRANMSASPFVSRTLTSTGNHTRKEISKSRHSIAGKTSPLKTSVKKTGITAVYQGRRSFSMYKSAK